MLHNETRYSEQLTGTFLCWARSPTVVHKVKSHNNGSTKYARSRLQLSSDRMQKTAAAFVVFG